MSQRLTWADVERLNAKVFAGRFKNRPDSEPAQPPCMECSTIGQAACPEHGTRQILRIVISGQIRGGKNNMIVTRTGLHFPKPEWAKWRDEAVARVKFQLPKPFAPINKPVNVRLIYVAGDKRRRDQPAILDSIFHVLEKAGVVSDDTLLWITESSRDYSKENPQAIIEFYV